MLGAAAIMEADVAVPLPWLEVASGGGRWRAAATAANVESAALLLLATAAVAGTGCTLGTWAGAAAVVDIWQTRVGVWEVAAPRRKRGRAALRTSQRSAGEAPSSKRYRASQSGAWGCTCGGAATAAVRICQRVTQKQKAQRGGVVEREGAAKLKLQLFCWSTWHCE